MRRASLLLSTAVTGAVGMGFEMIASRYLTPTFGGSLEVWAGLIATVMGGMAVGYLAGGRVADRIPSASPIAVTALLAAIWLSAVPAMAATAMEAARATFGDGGGGAMAAAALITGMPMALLSAAPPVAIRALTEDARRSGGIAGMVSGASTVGSIAGVLGTAFLLIPHMGTNASTKLLAALLACTAALVSLGASSNRTRTEEGAKAR